MFNLPEITRVGKVIPKKSFDQYANTKQKKLFTELVYRITWSNKLSKETINLRGNEVQEIQIFKIELKQKNDIGKVLEIIEKSIPYHIIFWIEFDDEIFVSASSKHIDIRNEDNSIVDWTFKSEWFKRGECPYELELNKSLDEVFKSFCVQLTGNTGHAKKIY